MQRHMVDLIWRLHQICHTPTWKSKQNSGSKVYSKWFRRGGTGKLTWLFGPRFISDHPPTINRWRAYQMPIESIPLIEVIWLMQLWDLARLDRSKQWGYAPVVDKPSIWPCPAGFGPFRGKCAVCVWTHYVRILRSYLKKRQSKQYMALCLHYWSGRAAHNGTKHWEVIGQNTFPIQFEEIENISKQNCHLMWVREILSICWVNK